MADSCSDQQVPVKYGVKCGVEITYLSNRKGMLQQSSYKAVMNRFGSGVILKLLGKCRIIPEEEEKESLKDIQEGLKEIK